ncbi:MAG: hypothetical protein WCD18_19185 [Thermosynechococcaceae cyanobacterium]
MHRKLKTILTVGGIALLVMAPALFVVGWVWQLHLDFVQARVDPLPNPMPQLGLVPARLEWGWGIPIALGFGLGGWQIYRTYRTAVFKGQIARLEKLWQQSTPQENYR